MGKINRVLLMLIAMGAIMLAAVGIDRGMQHVRDQKLEAERLARYEKAYADVADIEMTISQLAHDQKAIEAYLEEHRGYFDEMADPGADDAGEGESAFPEGPGGVGEGENAFPEGEAAGGPDEGTGGTSDGMNGGFGEDMDVSGNGTGSISANEVWGISGNGAGMVSGNEMWGVSGNGAGMVSGNEMWGVSGNGAGIVSANGIWDISGNEPGSVKVSGNGLQGGAGGHQREADLTLPERRKIRGSYMETRRQNKLDQEIIAGNEVDFSGVSIACLGDSITEAANLSDREDYKQYSYPARLKEQLGAGEVVNLGIGGSSIGRYWENAFVDRYREIPEDTDLILIMGGTNDGFCMNQEELGTMDERKERTFIGDLDELLKGLKENYPDAKIVLVTPLPNVLHDILRKERDYLLPQSTIVNAMKALAMEYEIPVIDLYNSNILDTHDAAVIYNYMPDGVHCNEAGYTLLAEHLAAELIRLYEEKEAAKAPAEAALPEPWWEPH